MGTLVYRLKYENLESITGSIVAAEVDLINLRLTGTEEDKKTVLPVLLEGDPDTAFPPLMQGRLYCDVRREESYYLSVFDLILTAHKIPFVHPAIIDYRESLRIGS